MPNGAGSFPHPHECPSFRIHRLFYKAHLLVPQGNDTFLTLHCPARRNSGQHRYAKDFPQGLGGGADGLGAKQHEVLLTNLARQQAELELKLGQESVLLNELISERNHIEIVLRGYRETWDSFRTLWDSFTGNAPVSQKTLSEYKNTLDNDLTADENITLLYEKAKLAVHEPYFTF